MGPTPPLSVDVQVRNGVRRVSLRGEIDLSTVDLFEERLSERDGTELSAVMLDLGDVAFMDSSGLHAILRARARSEQDGWRLLLVAVSPAVRRLFDVSGVAHLLDGDAVGVLDRFTSGMSANGKAPVGDGSRA